MPLSNLRWRNINGSSRKNSEPMLIRPESADDENVIRKLVYRAFENHPHHEPGAKPTEHEIVDRLRVDDALSLFLVAEEDGRISGHIAFSEVTVADQRCGWYGLGPVAVLPERRNAGIGAALIREGLARMKVLGAAGIVLLGEPNYYSRFGFKADSRLVLPGLPPDYFMVLPFWVDLPDGPVAYHPAFG